MWENKKRISLGFRIRTGAIKGSSSLLWSSDSYRGIHKQKLDAYCEYRAWPRSYEKHGGEVACLTGIFFLRRIPDGWTRSWNCEHPLHWPCVSFCLLIQTECVWSFPLRWCSIICPEFLTPHNEVFWRFYWYAGICLLITLCICLIFYAFVNASIRIDSTSANFR